MMGPDVSQTVTSKVSTGASKSLYQARPWTVAFSKKAGSEPGVDKAVEEELRERGKRATRDGPRRL